jgi:DNA-binding transcriptional LysR family regulator
VREGVSDFGIGPPPIKWAGPVCRLGWEEFKIVLPHDDPLADRDMISLGDLADREWVMFDADNGLYDLVVAACATGSTPPFMPRPAVLTSQVEAAARLASAGVGPALVPENAVPSDLHAAVVRADPPIGRELTVYARADWTPLGKAFLELMRARPWHHPPLDATVIA